MNIKKIVSLFLGLIMIFVSNQMSYACNDFEGENTKVQICTEESSDEKPLYTMCNDGELSLDELASAEMSKEDIPEILENKSEVINKYHVKRLREQEDDLNTYIFQNDDGTKTAYVFNEPVKYIDNNNNIIDKNTKFIESSSEEFKYENDKNDIKIKIPENIEKNAIEVSNENFKIKIKPEKALKNNNNVKIKNRTPYEKIVLSSNGTTVENIEYPETFGEKTSFFCQSLYNGVQLNIENKDNLKSISFCINVGKNKKIIQKNGKYDIIEVETNNVIASLDTYIDENTTVEINKKLFSNENIMTISSLGSLPQNLSLVLYTSANGKENIEDYTLKTTSPYINHPSDEKLYIGRQDSSTVYRTAVNFPCLKNGTYSDSLIDSLAADNLIKAELCLTDIKPNDKKICLQAYYYNMPWTESQIINDSHNFTALGAFISETTTEYYPKRIPCAIDITSAFKAWKKGEKTNNGIILKAKNENEINVHEYASIQNSSFIPYVGVTYKNGPLLSGHYYKMYVKDKNNYIPWNNRMEGISTTSEDLQYSNKNIWRVYQCKNGYYRFQSAHKRNGYLATGFARRVITSMHEISENSDTSASIGNDELWDVKKQEGSNAYTLWSKAYNGFRLCLGGNSLFYFPLSQEGVTSDSVYFVEVTEEEIDIYPYFDNEFYKKHNYSNSLSHMEINSLLNETKDFFENRFYFDITLKNASRFNSLASQCINIGADGLCKCYGESKCYENHHTNAELNLSYLKNNTNHFVKGMNVLFSGYNFGCGYRKNDDSHGSIAAGIGDRLGNDMVVFYKYNTTLENPEYPPTIAEINAAKEMVHMHNSITTAHEFAHLLGAKDHYDKRYNDERDYCLFGIDRHEQPLSQASLCKTCYDLIWANKFTHYTN